MHLEVPLALTRAFDWTEMKGALRPCATVCHRRCSVFHRYLVFIAVPSVKEISLYNTFVDTLKGNKFYLQKAFEVFEVTWLRLVMIKTERPQDSSVLVKYSVLQGQKWTQLPARWSGKSTNEPCALCLPVNWILGVNTNKSVLLWLQRETARCVMLQISSSQSHHLVAVYHHHSRGVSFIFLSDIRNSA